MAVLDCDLLAGSEEMCCQATEECSEATEECSAEAETSSQSEGCSDKQSGCSEQCFNCPLFFVTMMPPNVSINPLPAGITKQYKPYDKQLISCYYSSAWKPPDFS
jgi:hypothetical protein